jgi:hypothetical protein
MDDAAMDDVGAGEAPAAGSEVGGRGVVQAAADMMKVAATAAARAGPALAGACFGTLEC